MKTSLLLLLITVFLGASPVKAATLWLSLEGTIEQVFRLDGAGGVIAVDPSPVPIGTRWSLAGLLGDRNSSAHVRGIDLLGGLSFGETLYLTFEAGQVTYESGSGGRDSSWSISIENEPPDNPTEMSSLVPGALLDEVGIYWVLPGWAEATPPIGTILFQQNKPDFHLSLRTPEGGLFIYGKLDQMVVAVPEPSVAFLAGVSGLWWISRRRRLLRD